LFTPKLNQDQNKKFVFHWTGPYKIKKVHENNNIEIAPLNGPPMTQRVHVSRTKKCFLEEDHPPQKEHQFDLEAPDFSEWEIDEIIDHEIIKEKEYYLVHFQGWTNKYNQWVAKEDLKAEELLKKFHRGRKQ